MNRKQFLFVALMAALIGCAGIIVFNRSRQSWTIREAKTGEKVFPGFRVNDVAAIHIRGSSDFNVVVTNGIWSVPERRNYPANYSQIKDLLLKLAEIRALESDLVGPSQLARLGLNPSGTGSATGTLFEFRDAKGSLLARLTMGKKHDRPHNAAEPKGLRGLFDGRYVLLPDDPGRVLLISDELISAAPEPGMWLKPDFFKVENIKFLSVASTNSADSWEISRDNSSSPWLLANSKPGETPDNRVVADAIEILAFSTFVDVLPTNQSSSLASSTNQSPTSSLSHPAKVVTALTDNFAYTLKLSPRQPDGNHLMTVSVAGDLLANQPSANSDSASPQSSKRLQDKLAAERALSHWVYVVDSWIELVIRDRAQILAKPTIADQHGAQ